MRAKVLQKNNCLPKALLYSLACLLYLQMNYLFAYSCHSLGVGTIYIIHILYIHICVFYAGCQPFFNEKLRSFSSFEKSNFQKKNYEKGIK